MTTYTELSTNLQAYTEDAGDLVAQIPDIVSRAEIRISKDLNVDAMNQIATAPLVTGAYWLNKPDDWTATLSLEILDGSARTTLEMATESFINDYWRSRTQTGVPKFYCNWDQEWFLIAPSADKDYTAELKYEARIVGLSPSTATTWISLNHPDLLFKRCLCESAVFHKNPGVKAVYEADYAEDLRGAKEEVVRQRSDATNLRRKGR